MIPIKAPTPRFQRIADIEFESKASSDMTFRHECECRYVVALPSNARRAEYLAGVERRRGAAAAERLRRDVWQLMRVAA